MTSQELMDPFDTQHNICIEPPQNISRSNHTTTQPGPLKKLFARLKPSQKPHIRQEQKCQDHCSICQFPFLPRDKSSFNNLKCRHVFHDTCLQQYLTFSKLCPNCRKKIQNKKAFFSRKKQ